MTKTKAMKCFYFPTILVLFMLALCQKQTRISE